MVCDRTRPVTGSVWPSGPEIPRKSHKVFPGLSPGNAKSQKSKESQKSTEARLFETLSTFSGLFWHSGPGKTFLRLFRDFGPGGSDTPCSWALQLQGKEKKSLILGGFPCALPKLRPFSVFWGARLKGCTTTHASKKGSGEGFWGRVLGKGACYWFCSKKGF